MTVASDDRECWFLTGSQHLYGQEALEQVQRQSAEVVAELNAAAEVGARVIAKPVLTSADAIRRACLEANSDDNCIGVFAWMHTFSPAKAWIPGLKALGKPLLHFHTQANRSLPWDAIDMDFMNLNQAAHGDREFGYIATRMGIRRKTVVGHVSDPRVRERIGAWVRAAAGWRQAQRLRVVRFGDNMRDVAVTDGDRVEAQIRFGWSVQTYGINDLASAVDAAAQSEIARTAAAYQREYRIDPVLAAGGARHQSLLEAAKIEVGLRSFLEQGDFGAFTTNFQDLGGLSQLPGIAAQRLMADGYGFGAEGDWKTAALLRVIKVMAAGRLGGTSFMEDYTYDFGPDDPVVLGAHMLEVCPSIAAEQPSCEIHPLGIGDRDDPVRLVFTAAPAAAIVIGILDLGDRFRLVANEIEVVAPAAPLPKLPVARAIWKPAPDLATSAECWITAGGPHHSVLTSAIDRESLDDLASIADVELVWIDQTTTAGEFRHRLDWNDAHYRTKPR